MERTAFLDRLRVGLARPATPNLAHPLPPLGGPVPPVTYVPPVVDPVSRFRDASEAVGAHVRVLAAMSEVPALIAEVLAAHKVATAVVSDDLECNAAVECLKVAGVSARPFTDAASAANADLGVTGAAFGIAATGTLVLSAARAGCRSAGLLPPVHLAFVRADRILRDAGELLRQLPARFPAGLPSQLVFATGPSRSADIELVITVGVHGPGAVWVGVLPPAEEPDHPSSPTINEGVTA